MRNALVALSFLGASQALAFNPQPDPPGFMLVGIAQEQVARVSVVNTGSTTCNVRLSMIDGDGDVIASQIQAVAPGDRASLAVAGSEIVAAGTNRALVRAKVTSTDNPGALPPDPCVASFSLHDARTGATVFAGGRTKRLGSTRAVTPLVTASAGQRMQMTLVNLAADVACQATLSFRAPGNRTLASRTITLAAGQSTVLDIGTTQATWGVIELAPGTPPDPCMPSFAVYDMSTGATQAGGAISEVSP